jgi:hypothetical protein
MKRSSFYCPKLMDMHVEILGALIQLMGCFEVHPSYLLGFFSKYECWATDLVMPLSFYFIWVVTCLFISLGFISL